jgi:DNA polymerase elongation subunit (family B)
MTLWMIPSDGGKRLRLVDRAFRPAFFVHGPEARLQRLKQKISVSVAGRATCALTERKNIWDARPLVVLEVSVLHPTEFRSLARWVRRLEPQLTFYNSDLMLEPLYCWEKNVFPFARVEVEVDGAGARTGFGIRGSGFVKEKSLVANRESRVASPEVRALQCRDDEWAVDYELPPLRVMRARLEGLTRVDPKHGRRGALEVTMDDDETQVLDDSDEPVACGFERLLRAHDPDLITTEWGDSTLFPGLLRQAARSGVELSLNRDPAYGRNVERSRARSYMSYGRILFKESATTLRGRLHVDTQNSFIADQCHLEGLWELARVTKLPVQYSARTTTGTGISYMQMELAWRDGTLIPEQKAEPESPKHPDELLRADRGGLVFPPRLGFFENVAELDFVSEFPNIMARFNVSPETVNCACCPDAPRVPELGYRICQRRRGITSRVVERLIAKRGEFKRRMKMPGFGIWVSGFGKEESSISAPESRAVAPPFKAAGAGLRPGATNPEPRNPNPESYKLRRSSLKWLLVCCFGYTGYKNARFGKIEAHEAINALAREKLLVAMDTAERAGFRVLHALVDSLYVQKIGSEQEATREEFEQLGEEIERRTQLPIAIEDVYRYVVFLPSKQSAEIPVPNRFFCVPESGEPKVRGLECRRHDTPPIVVRMQTEVLKILSEARDYAGYCEKLEDARQVLARYLARVEDGTAPAEELVISRRLTRAPGEYKQSNVTAVVARQLDQAGVKLRPGETIEYILTDTDAHLPDDRARAWTLWEGWRGYDVAEYMNALRQAFQPFARYATARLVAADFSAD